MENFSLRKARTIEVGNVKALYQSVVGQDGCIWNELYPSSEDLMNDYNSGCLYIFILNDTKLIGAASVVPQNELDDLDCWRINDGTQKEIARVVISRTFQGKSYSKKMLKLLLPILKEHGCKAVHLLVSMDNNAAISTYKALGFDFIDKCERYGHSYYACERLF